MDDLPKRHAISRAHLFLRLAKQCTVEMRDECEAFMEASIIFGRTAMHRLQSKYEHNPSWKPWWNGLRGNPAVEFFKKERDCILKEGPPKVNQIIGLGGTIPMAVELYYYENPETPAVNTIEKHLRSIESIIIEAQDKFDLS